MGGKSSGDRATILIWELDLSLAGKVYSPKTIPVKRTRQRIGSFVGCEGEIERFSIRQTIPDQGYDAFCPPTQRQYDAVMSFFLEPCETRFQAHTLLSAKSYADKVARRFPFNSSRRHLLWICTTAFILSDSDLRSLVRTWSVAHDHLSPSATTGVYLRCYRKIVAYAEKLVADIQSQGASVFG